MNTRDLAITLPEDIYFLIFSSFFNEDNELFISLLRLRLVSHEFYSLTEKFIQFQLLFPKAEEIVDDLSSERQEKISLSWIQRFSRWSRLTFSDCHFLFNKCVHFIEANDLNSLKTVMARLQSIKVISGDQIQNYHPIFYCDPDPIHAFNLNVDFDPTTNCYSFDNDDYCCNPFISKQGETILNSARKHKQQDILNYFFSLKVNGNRVNYFSSQKDISLLSWMILCLQPIEMIEEEIKRQQDYSKNQNQNQNQNVLDNKDTFNKNVLFYAIKANYIEVVQLLLKNKANPNISISKNVYNNPSLCKRVLHYAVEKNRMEIVKLLLEKDADSNSKDRDEYTPFSYAIFHRLNSNPGCDQKVDNLEMISCLLENNAEELKRIFNYKLENLNLPECSFLFLATYSNDSSLVKLFLEYDADFDAKVRLKQEASSFFNSDISISAYDWAKKHSYQKILQLFNQTLVGHFYYKINEAIKNEQTMLDAPPNRFNLFATNVSVLKYKEATEALFSLVCHDNQDSDEYTTLLEKFYLQIPQIYDALNTGELNKIYKRIKDDLRISDFKVERSRLHNVFRVNKA